jgi:hypothetical protein
MKQEDCRSQIDPMNRRMREPGNSNPTDMIEAASTNS